jgi:pyruvate dehydrogenase E2 component (dihydrolipoamide acetyltransferase)
MSVSVSMPQLGESVTEGTVTRWLKREGEHVEADEPLLEVSTDKVDTEIPSPVSGVLRGITVAEDETVAVGAELAVIDEDGSAGQPAAPAQAEAPAAAEPAAEEPEAAAEPAQTEPAQTEPAQTEPAQPEPAQPAPPAYAPPPAAEPAPAQPGPAQAAEYAEAYQQPQAYAEPAYTESAPPAQEQPAQEQPAQEQPAPVEAAPAQAAAVPAPPGYDSGNGAADATTQFADGTDGPYVTPLVRKLAAEHGIDLATVSGTGVGGRIRKQDILDAARVARGPESQAPAPQGGTAPQASPAPQAGPAPLASTAAQANVAAAPPAPAQPAQAAPVTAAPVAAPVVPAPAFSAPAADTAATRRSPIVPSNLRGTTERMSRARQVIAQRMVESLQTSAQLTTVVEADVTAIARLRERAKAPFEAREGVKLSFLPFFALAAVEALKVHPKLNAVIDTGSGQVTYHDAEHLGIAVDTERGLMVPVIRNAGDLNIGGLARKIADLAERTRAGQVSPDDLAGGTFTLTNTGSRGALFDTPIINQPQVGILGTGTVVKRAVVVEDPTLGEVITVRSMVYLALTYDHRLVDGADAARFLVTMKARLEEGAFETELGL